jgi:perosamine synthetase
MINHNKPYLDSKDSEAMVKVLKSSFIAQGIYVEKFENEFVNCLDKKGYACALSNGTSALFLALYALGIKKGDEVILPTYVCSAVLNAIFMLKATPVLTDIEINDFNISFKEARMRMSKKTKVIIIPHTFGVPADLDKFRTLGIHIVEDCAQAIGAKYKGHKVGTIGDISIFSFYATKLLTTGNGGMVFSKHKRYIDKIRDYRNFDECKKYYPRFNFQMTDLQAALGLSQLKKLNMFLKRRNKVALMYIDSLKDSKIKFQESGLNCERVFFRFVILSKHVKKIREALSKKGIQAIVPIENYELLHNYLNVNKKNFSNAEYVSNNSLSIPLYPAIKDLEVKNIIKELREL